MGSAGDAQHMLVALDSKALRVVKRYRSFEPPSKEVGVHWTFPLYRSGAITQRLKFKGVVYISNSGALCNGEIKKCEDTPNSDHGTVCVSWSQTT